MKPGDRVLITHDNYGARGRIVDVRDQEPRWLVRTDGGQEVWCFSYEVESDD